MQGAKTFRAFSSVPAKPLRRDVSAHARAPSRRQLLEAASLASFVAAVPLPAAAKGLKGFQSIRDAADGYEFAFPFGWQEVSVNGVEAVYKDVIEPLESVSVQLTPTERQTIVEYGPPNEIAGTLANSVLTSPSDEVQLVKSEPEQDGDRDYVAFEFLQKSGRFTRHVLAIATVANGKLILFSIGASEKRWNKVQKKLATSAKSFKAFTVFSG